MNSNKSHLVVHLLVQFVNEVEHERKEAEGLKEVNDNELGLSLVKEGIEEYG
ncbi:24426_t:CDS:2 [Entrophospora sp. SA101]|nr:24426_t:CDS:2 [Entrophospora sp. SA101]